MEPPRNGPRISHVVLIYYPENVEQAVTQLERMLDIELPVVTSLSPAIRTWINFTAGLVVISPGGRAADTGAAGALGAALDSLYEHLDNRGEGPVTVVFGVPDIDSAIERAVAAGATLGGRYRTPPAELAEEFEHYEEAEIGSVRGVNWVLARLVPKA